MSPDGVTVAACCFNPRPPARGRCLYDPDVVPTVIVSIRAPPREGGASHSGWRDGKIEVTLLVFYGGVVLP